MSEQQPGWERNVIEKLAFESLREARRRRRWSIFFRALGFIYVGTLIWVLIGARNSSESLVDGAEHTALVRIEGTIAAGEKVDAESVLPALRAAFEAKQAKGVLLLINSPGGSPVQAGLINDEIHRLRKLHPDKPVHAVVEDVCASGGYYIAVAADKIFVDKASIVGSIGVRMDGFGFTGTMEKLGVERRSITAGENKAFLDPFSPQNPKHVEFAKGMLAEVHQQFIDVVRAGRGKRLKESPEMFSGLFWSGAKSIELGLADGLGSLDSVARDEIKAEKIKDYTRGENVAERIAKRFGADLAGGAMGTLERFGWR
ncbi:MULTISPECIES: S49 family peptidase [unclassified Uliginosibacterium]|uniref:S49 family peptidase n=1 Tax=unclassified Uliginosibacterium TaxID=2621521 RepID=UPI000C7AEEB7|nr:MULTISPECIES: S49 family peptidase [unclassified Uliginosibacterium]MDO6388277.1 S49 family peptidase [Uliginosibacterium sp. 31-12]PLK47363.1 S49 family peptidase [Uliginosibacterium sp. TH139]